MLQIILNNFRLFSCSNNNVNYYWFEFENDFVSLVLFDTTLNLKSSINNIFSPRSLIIDILISIIHSEILYRQYWNITKKMLLVK